MGIFRQFPYTNFHDLNLDWILAKIKELWNGVEAIDEKVDNFIIDTEPTIRDEVDKWLDDHPEATTTVQDHSLDYNKLINGTLEYLFPQMFGAVGDGINDDTPAFIDMFEKANTEKMPVIIPKGTYNIDELFITDDEIVVINNGTFPKNEPIISKQIVADIKPTLINSLYINDPDIVGKTLQGACYDSKRNRVVFAYVNSSDDTAPAVIFAYTPDFSEQLQKNIINPVSHFNDLAYDPISDLIYTPNRQENDFLYTINPETLTVENTVNIDFGDVIRRISYDDKHNLFYVHGVEFLKIYDHSFTLIHTVNCNLEKVFREVNCDPNEFTVYMQGSTVINDQFMFIWCYGDSNGIPNVNITQLNYINENTKNNYVYNTIELSDEVEALYTIGDDLYILSTGASKKIQVFKYNVAEPNITTSPVKSIIPIKENTNVDNLVNIGTYTCGGNNTAQSLTNCPTNKAFRMYVVPSTSGTHLLQIYTTIDGEIYIRKMNYGTLTWSYVGQVLTTIYKTVNSWRVEENCNKILHAFRAWSTESISNWTQIGSSGLYVSPELSVDLPIESGRVFAEYEPVASCNNYSWVTNFYVSGSNLTYRIVSGQNTARTFIVRCQFDGRIS